MLTVAGSAFAGRMPSWEAFAWVQVQRFFSPLVNVGGKEQRREISRIPRATWMLYITSDPDLKRIRSREPAGQR
jgi:hypothetical protein